VSIQSRHPEVAEPQPNRSTQDLECYPAFGSSGSSHCDDEGSPLTPTLSRRARGKRAAFTLAEVLITLAIIGVVATMTIPTLISGYKKNVVEVKLSRFNAMMTQVVKLSTIDNGDTSTWDTSDLETFYNTYLASYLKPIRTQNVGDVSFEVYLPDGSAFSLDKQSMIHMNFYPYASNMSNDLGKNDFVFMFYPDEGALLDPNGPYCNSPYLGEGKGFVPYFFYIGDEDYWDSENNCHMIVYPAQEKIHDVLMNKSTYGCANGGAYCTKLIQMNNWKIPDDYPIKF